MTKHQNRVPENLDLIKRVVYPGPFNDFLDADIYLSYKGEICHDEDYGFKPSNSSDWFTELKSVDNKGLYHLRIKSLRMLRTLPGEAGQHDRVEFEPIKEETYKEIVTKHSVSDRPPLGPSRRISFLATKGPLAGRNFEVDIIIELPVIKPGQSSGSSDTKKVKVVGEGRFCPFCDHEDLTEIYGWAKYFREYNKHIFCFNTRHPDIRFISLTDNTKEPYQKRLIEEMFNITNEGLEFHLEEASLAGELKNERLISKYGSMTNYVLNQRFEILISACIEKIKDDK